MIYNAIVKIATARKLFLKLVINQKRKVMEKEKIVQWLNTVRHSSANIDKVADEIIKGCGQAQEEQTLPKRLSNSAYIRATHGNYESFMEWWDKQL